MDNLRTSYNSPTTKSLFRATQIIWYVLGIIEFILGLRFVLRLLAANPSAGFTNFIYDLSYPLVAPFLGVFGQTSSPTGNVFEWTTLLAMLIYYLVAWGLITLFVNSKPVSTPEASVKLDQQK